MTLTVLSNKEQYQALLSSFSNIDEIKILCDNPDFHDFLTHKNIKFEPLRDECFKNSWVEINTWACEKALLWNRLIEDKPFFNGIELHKAFYVYFSYYLVSFLKNYLFAEAIFKEYNPQKIVVFKEIYSPHFSKFNGNYFLNIFLEYWARQHGVETIYLSSNEKADSCRGISLREKIRFSIQSIYANFVAFHRKQNMFMICGSLRHLTPLMKSLKNNGQNLFLYDFDFHLDRFWFCIKNNIKYLVPECFSPAIHEKKNGIINYKEDFVQVVNIMRLKRWFTYKDIDLSGFICDELLSKAAKYLDDISLWAFLYSRVINTFNINGLIVDEDIAPKNSFMAAFFKSKGIKTFCISHGYGAIKFSLPSPERIFFLSETFIHSEYERLLYSSWGWDPNHLHVTGIPRYDRLVEIKKRKENIHRGSKTMKIMFCGATMFYHFPGEVCYVGVRQYEDGYHMRNCLKNLIEAIDGYAIELIVRPHHIQDKKLWLDFIEENKRQNKIILAPATIDFFDLLSQCDAMCLGHWSTAIMESVILNIPVAVIDYSNREDTHPFVKEDLCTIARTPEQLKSIIQKLYSAFHSKEYLQPAEESNKSHSFYLGENDGNNTQRIIDKIFCSSVMN